MHHNPADARLAVWRDLYPVTKHVAYLNHAAVAPLARPTRAAMEQLLADVAEYGALHWEDWVARYEQTRRSAAGLIGAAAEEIAFLKNTSEGLAMVALGLDWRRGDRVVTVESEFPANLYPWLALRDRGVVVDLVSERDGRIDLDELRQHCRGARLLAISFVQYLSGFRIDLEAVGAICREAGCWFVLDAIQGLGAFPVDVKRAGVHALAADGHKWLTGPEGCAVFYVDRDALEELQPREIGWMSVERWNDFEAAAQAARGAPAAWRKGTARFECGTSNTVGLYGLGAAIDLVMSVGIEVIASRVSRLRQHLAGVLASTGCEILGWDERADESGSRGGILSFRRSGIDARSLVEQLLRARICCAARNGWVRCAPHFYNDVGELDRLVEVVRRTSAA